MSITMPQIAESKPAIDAFIARHDTVAALPENMSRIVQMAGDRDCNTTQLVRLISQDAALAGQIMKAVNSAYYALPTKLTRLDRAVAFMGLRAVKEVTLSETLRKMSKPVKLGNYDARSLWDHSIGVAIMARELALKSKAMDSEEAFLAGMLHDIALLLAAQSEPANGAQLFTKAEAALGRFEEIEQEIYGFSHCELGERLAGKWKLPEQVASVMRWHHEPRNAPKEHRAMCIHIYVADTLCCQANVGCPLTCREQQVTDEDLSATNLSREVTAEIAGKLRILLRLFMN
jgi:HD-like signal output (HDOD) protein